MTDPISPSLLSAWNTYGQLISYVIAGVGVLILLGHFVKLATTRDFKLRYDYINMHEINLLWYGFLLILTGIALFANTLKDSQSWLWFFIWLFLSIMLALIVGVIVQNILKFYYPFFIEKRLKKLRYTPRTSPEGRKMKLLNIEEEKKNWTRQETVGGCWRTSAEQWQPWIAQN